MTMRRFFIIFLLICAVGLGLWYDSNNRVVTERFTVASEKLPEGLDGLKIVDLSDVHVEDYGGEVLRRVREEDPDIITLTGDLINGRGEDEAREREFIDRFIPELVSVAPVYYITGNHEWASPWVRELFGVLRDYGVTVLRNEYVLISSGEESIVLCGLDDPNGPADMKKPGEVIADVREAEGDKMTVLLYHRNDRLDLWAELGVDLVLCGHAHGGMVRLPFTDGLYGPGHEWFPAYTNGIYEKDGTTMLVSRGIGGPRLRVLNNPEVVSVTLTRE